MPELFKGWDIVWCPEMIDTGHSIGWEYSRASIWSGMNFFMINPDLAVVHEAQKPLIKVLAQHGIETIPLKLRHTRTLSGGFHCVTLDIRRRGVLEDHT
jgi:glycine amidinotransferase